MKLYLHRRLICGFTVAPYTGAWIEMLNHTKFLGHVDSRSLHGSVD
ncbi:hypothetical protein [Caproicibacterium sp. XB2]